LKPILPSKNNEKPQPEPPNGPLAGVDDLRMPPRELSRASQVLQKTEMSNAEFRIDGNPRIVPTVARVPLCRPNLRLTPA
jgi:hypothetical protein